MAVNDVFQLTVRQVMHGQTLLNVLHYKQTVLPATGTSEQSLATAFINNVLPTWKSFQAAELAHTAVVVQKIFPAPPTLALIDATGAASGSIANQPLPTSVTAVITKRTVFAGRKYRGRVFIAGIPENYEDDSMLTSTGVTNYQTLANLLASAITFNTGSFKPVLWHRVSSTSDDVTACILRPTIRSQRRRQVGVGQ